MPKVNALTDLSNLSSTSFITAFNQNNDRIESAFTNTLSRDGSGPNNMLADIDMGGFKVINLPDPTLPHEAVPLGYLEGRVNELNETKLDEAIDAYNELLGLREEVIDLRDEAEDFRDQAAAFVGAATSAQRLSTPRSFEFTGNVTGSIASFDGSANVTGTLTIASNVVTNSMLSNVPQNTIKGRVASGSGAPSDLTGAQVVSFLPVFGTSVNSGIVSNGGTTNTNQYLRRDGSWASPPSVSVPAQVSPAYTDEFGSVSLGNMFIKWGRYQTTGTSEGPYTIYYPSAFPNATLTIQLTAITSGASNTDDQWPQLIAYSSAGFSFYKQQASGGGGNQMTITWFALGW